MEKFRHKNPMIVKPHRVALIIGVTDMVGNSLAEILPSSGTPGGPWRIYGVARRPRPKWISDHPLSYIQCDVTDAKDTRMKLSRLTDVTHLFWVTSDVDGAMFQNVLKAVLPHAPYLAHICLLTGHRSRPTPNSLEDMLMETCSKKVLTWSVHRLAVIFGFSPNSAMNLIGSLCIYAAVCKYEHAPLKFPGTKAAWNCYSTASDADLIAEQQIWAAADPHAQNQTYSCSNGDIFKWSQLWKILADQFEIEFVEFDENAEFASLSERMKDKGAVWDEIVEKNGLAPMKLDQLAAFWYVDEIFSGECVLDIYGMNKSKENGFLGFRNTAKSLVSVVADMKAHKIIPDGCDPEDLDMVICNNKVKRRFCSSCF